MVGWYNWFWCPRWHGGGVCKTDSTSLHRKIHLQWYWLHLWFDRQPHFHVLAEVVTCVFTGGASISLDLLLSPISCQHHDFCGGPIGVLRVSLLLGYCQASLRIGLDIRHVWTLLFYLSKPGNLLCCHYNCDSIYSIWSYLTLTGEEVTEVV